MKNNNKNRKLRFIRIKNKLRQGIIKFYCYDKTAKDIDLDENYCANLIETAKKSLLKIYNLKLKNIEMQLEGSVDDDFIKNLNTNRVILYN